MFETLKSGSVLQVGVPFGERVFGKAVKGRSSVYGWCRAYIDHESSDVHFSFIDESADCLSVLADKESASRDWEPRGQSRPVREDGPALTAFFEC